MATRAGPGPWAGVVGSLAGAGASAIRLRAEAAASATWGWRSFSASTRAGTASLAQTPIRPSVRAATHFSGTVAVGQRDDEGLQDLGSSRAILLVRPRDELLPVLAEGGGMAPRPPGLSPLDETQGRRHAARRGVTFARVLRESLAQQRNKRGREARRPQTFEGRGFAQLLLHRGEKAVAAEGDVSGEDLEENDPQCVDVALKVPVFASNLLGAHVLGRAREVGGHGGL